MFFVDLILLLLLLLLLHLPYQQANATSSTCNFFHGNWVIDSSYPLYDSTFCPFIEKEFNCLKNGRPDRLYLKYRWQPDGCNLVRFNGQKFLEKYRGKRIMFVGDSLTRDQYMSLTCMLYNAVPGTNYTMIRDGLISTLTFPDYDFKLTLDRNAFLVDLQPSDIGVILKIDRIAASAKLWANNDMLVFNTWHWWTYKGAQQPWKYIKIGERLLKDMDRMVAFETGLSTWATWVDQEVDTGRTKVFFLGVSPSHYIGAEWNQRGANCSGQTHPLPGSIYPVGQPPALAVQKKVMSKMVTPVVFLDITVLSQLRIDGHPSFYGVSSAGTDCTHWCLAGVPDTWNLIMYNFIFS